MRVLWCLALFASILAACDSKHASTIREGAVPEAPKSKWTGGPPHGWMMLEAPLDQYVARNPGRPIIVSFGATWGETTEIAWRVIAKDGVTEALHKAGFVCIAADRTDGNPLVSGELERLRLSAVPANAIYDPTTRKWELETEFAAEKVIELADSIGQRIAEQGGPGDGEKPKN